MLNLEHTRVYKTDDYFLCIECEVETTVGQSEGKNLLVEKQIFRAHVFCDKSADLEEAIGRGFARLTTSLAKAGVLSRVM